MIAWRLASCMATVQAGGRASGTMATRLSMKSAWETPHCSTCMRGGAVLMPGLVVRPLPIASVAMMRYLSVSCALPGRS